MDKATILGILRHLLTTVGGAMATRGYVGDGDVELIAGALVTLAGVGMSVWDKRAKGGDGAQ